MLAVGMTGDAIGSIGEIRAARDIVGSGSANCRRQRPRPGGEPRLRRGNSQQDRRGGRPQGFSFSRKFVWQLPQPFFPRSAKAVRIVA